MQHIDYSKIKRSAQTSISKRMAISSKRSVTTRIKPTANLDHNNNIEKRAAEDHVDSERTKYNITLVQETLSEAYEHCFGEAVSEYNSRQKRASRRKTDYFKELFGVSADSEEAKSVLQSENEEKSFYEYLVEIGNRNNTGAAGYPNENAEKAKNALIEYAKGFSERNPNFYVFNEVIHMDEATPHLHLDLIPVADGYKNGMSKRNGYNRALEQMGYGGANGFNEWREKEREVFREICKSYGLNPKEKDEEEPSHTYTPPRQYRAMMKEAEEIKSEAEKEKLKYERETKLLQEKEDNMNKREMILTDQEKRLREEEITYERKAREMAQKQQEVEQREKSLHEHEAALDERERALNDKITHLDKDIHLFHVEREKAREARKNELHALGWDNLGDRGDQDQHTVG